MARTFGEMMATVQNWLREPMDDSILFDAVNDAVESLWMSVLLVHVGAFFNGPTTLSVANASERLGLGAVLALADPTVAPAAANVAGGSLAARTYYITYTYVTESGSETLESPVLTFAATLNNLCQVTAPAFLAGAMGWNVYIGDVPGRRARQNEVPIDFNLGNWTESATGVVDNPDLPLPPTVNNTADNIFYIRHMELLTPDGTYKAWNQVDIDSEMMRRAARSIASTSQYQNYMYDLVNQLTLEIRPAAGAALSPRMFWVYKPRRARFKNALFPFLTIPYDRFVRFHALSDVTASLYEEEKSLGWERKAQAERMQILLAVNQMNRQKDRRVTPYLQA